MNIRFSLFFLIGITLFVLPVHVLAINFGDSLVTDTANAAQISTDQTLPSLIGSLIRAALGLLGIFFLIITIYAGFLWATANGSEDNIKKAKKLLVNGVIGMIIMLSSYAITEFVLGLIAEERPAEAMIAPNEKQFAIID